MNKTLNKYWGSRLEEIKLEKEIYGDNEDTNKSRPTKDELFKDLVGRLIMAGDFELEEADENDEDTSNVTIFDFLKEPDISEEVKDIIINAYYDSYWEDITLYDYITSDKALVTKIKRLCRRQIDRIRRRHKKYTEYLTA